MEEEDLQLSSPSFNSYSTNGLTEIAIRVSRESSRFGYHHLSDQKTVTESIEGEDGGFDGDEFEFISLLQEPNELVFFDSYSSGPVFPVFNHDLVVDEKEDDHDRSESSVRIPFEKLMIGYQDHDSDREHHPSSSSVSSEADDLEGVSAGTYCVWTPPQSVGVPESEGKSKSNIKIKSRSTGSDSKRFRLRDLLRRSNSDGKYPSSFVFLTPSSRSNSIKKEEKIENEVQSNAKRISGQKTLPSAHERFYVRNRMLKEEGRKKSYLPYRQDLVGFWANVNSS